MQYVQLLLFEPIIFHDEILVVSLSVKLLYKINLNFYFLGVVSWGIGCATPDIPGIYTNVVKYLDWIEKNTKDAVYCMNNLTKSKN